MKRPLIRVETGRVKRLEIRRALSGRRGAELRRLWDLTDAPGQEALLLIARQMACPKATGR